MTLTSVLLVAAIALGAIAFKEGWSIPILNPSDPQTGNGENNNGDDEPPVVDNSPRLPCFTFIDASLAKDGFTYLGEGQWGRGKGTSFGIDWANNFVFTMPNLTFALLEVNMHMLPSDWYRDYQKYSFTVYYHEFKEVRSPRSVATSGVNETNTRSLAVFNDEMGTFRKNSRFYHKKLWMDYYVEKFASAGCPIEDIDVATLERYKTQMSTATQNDVVSVFDRVSTDGVVRYFKDVHKEGIVQDHPRFREIKTLADFDALDVSVRESLQGEQLYYMFAIYHDRTNRVFLNDFHNIQGPAIEHFVKDVMFRFTIDSQDNPRNIDTLGLYFFYIDNPNGQFESFYGREQYWDDPDMNLMRISNPFSSLSMIANVNQVRDRRVIPFAPGQIYYEMKFLIEHGLTIVNDEVVFAPEFIKDYTARFNPEWQHIMGLRQLFAERYGFIIDGVQLQYPLSHYSLTAVFFVSCHHFNVGMRNNPVKLLSKCYINISCI